MSTDEINENTIEAFGARTRYSTGLKIGINQVTAPKSSYNTITLYCQRSASSLCLAGLSAHKHE